MSLSRLINFILCENVSWYEYSPFSCLVNCDQHVKFLIFQNKRNIFEFEKCLCANRVVVTKFCSNARRYYEKHQNWKHILQKRKVTKLVQNKTDPKPKRVFPLLSHNAKGNRVRASGSFLKIFKTHPADFKFTKQTFRMKPHTIL